MKVEDIDVENIKYTEMYIDEMKAVKAKWKGYLREAKKNLSYLNNNEASYALIMSYTYFLTQIKSIVNIYSSLINKAEDCNLEEEDFLKAMKTVKLINKGLHIEYNKKTFKQLNAIYFGEKENHV